MQTSQYNTHKPEKRELSRKTSASERAQVSTSVVLIADDLFMRSRGVYLASSETQDPLGVARRVCVLLSFSLRHRVCPAFVATGSHKRGSCSVITYGTCYIMTPSLPVAYGLSAFHTFHMESRKK